MSPYDVTPDDAPLDMAAVSSDDAAIEVLRRSLSPDAAVVWDDDDDELDSAFLLLRSLQRDVSADLPSATAVLPQGVTRLVPRRRLGRTATMVAVAAGVLSIGGVAAASAPGQPLAGVRSSVTSAFTSVVDAITPDAPVGPTAAKPAHARGAEAKPSAEASPEPGPTSELSPKASPPGQAVSAAARSAAATRQVTELLDKAARLLDRGQNDAARAQLRSAAVRLPLVTDAASHDRLAARLSALRARLASPQPQPTRDSNGDGHGNDSSGDRGQPTARPTHAGDGSSSKHDGTPEPTRSPRVEKTAEVKLPGGGDQSGSGSH